MIRWIIFTEQRAGRPRHVVTLYSNPQWRPARRGVLRARKTGQWPVFTEERAGRPRGYAEFLRSRLDLRNKNSFLAALPPGVARARRTGQWPVLTEQQAGRPW